MASGSLARVRGHDTNYPVAKDPNQSIRNHLPKRFEARTLVVLQDVGAMASCHLAHILVKPMATPEPQKLFSGEAWGDEPTPPSLMFPIANKRTSDFNLVGHRPTYCVRTVRGGVVHDAEANCGTAG